MAIERVQAYFRALHMEERIRVLEASSATVELAAQALQCAPERIAKTLSFLVQDDPVLIVAAGDGRIDNQKYKAQFGTKAKMLTPEQAETMVGHAVGGVCPFAVNEGVKVYLDASLKRFETVFPACGSANSAIELTLAELEKYSGGPPGPLRTRCGRGHAAHRSAGWTGTAGTVCRTALAHRRRGAAHLYHCRRQSGHRMAH